jgi:hypothetical protein
MGGPLSVNSPSAFDGNGSGLRRLFPAPEKEEKNHAEDGKQEDHENPQQLLDRVRVALEAIHDRDDIQHKNNQTQ